MDEPRYTYGYNLGWNERNEYIESFQNLFDEYNKQLKILKDLEMKYYIEEASTRKENNLTEEDLRKTYNEYYADSNISFEQFKKDAKKEESNQIDYFNNVTYERIADEYDANMYYMVNIKEIAIRKLNIKKRELEFKLKQASLEYQRNTLGKDADNLFLEIQKLRHAISEIDKKLDELKITKEESDLLLLRGLNPRSKEIYEKIKKERGIPGEEIPEKKDPEDPEKKNPEDDPEKKNPEDPEKKDPDEPEKKDPEDPEKKDPEDDPEKKDPEEPEKKDPEDPEKKDPEEPEKDDPEEDLGELPKVKIGYVNKHKMSKLGRVVLLSLAAAAIVALPAIGVLLGSSLATGFGISAAYGGLSAVFGGALGLAGFGLGTTAMRKVIDATSKQRLPEDIKELQEREIARYVNTMVNDINDAIDKYKSDEQELKFQQRKCIHRINLLKKELESKQNKKRTNEKDLLEIEAIKQSIIKLENANKQIDNFIEKLMEEKISQEEIEKINPEEVTAEIEKDNPDKTEEDVLSEEPQQEETNNENDNFDVYEPYSVPEDYNEEDMVDINEYEEESKGYSRH